MSDSRRLIHIVSSNTWSGVERYALDVCRSFTLRGWCVTAYTREALAVDKHFIDAGIDLRHAPLGGYYDLHSAWLLSRDLKHEQQGAIVHVHKYKDAFTAVLARKMCGRSDIRIVMTCHNAKKGHDSWLYRRIYRNINAHIFVSCLAMEQFLQTWNGRLLPFSREQLYMVHNSIFTESFEPITPPSTGPKIAMFHGRLSPEKGVETLIDALPKLKNKRIRLWIVGMGDPDYVDSLKRRALALDVMDMIDWKGYVKDVHDVIPLCHYGVLPSVWREPFGLANIEYMSHARPQICTDNGAQKEYLTEGVDALMVSPGDASALSDAMIKMSEDDQMREVMGDAAYKKFTAELSWKPFCDRLEKIYLNDVF